MRTRWLRRFLWLLGFACLWLPVLDDPPLHTDAYLVDVGADGATIGLVTATPARVQAIVRDAGGRQMATAGDGADGSDFGGEARRRHWFPIRGLAAATAYDYELRSEGGEVWRGRIRTPSTDDRAAVKFAFLGDSGDQPWWVWLQRSSLWHWPARWGWFGDSDAVTRVGAAVADYHAEFVLHLGDVIYPKGLHAHYRSGFFRPFAAALREAPVYALLGNHDMMDGGGLQLMANLRAPQRAGGLTGDGRNVSFAWGSVRVIMLDCNSEFTGERFEAGHPAHAFLLHELAACREPWIVVASHFPMRSQSRQGDRADLLLSLRPQLEAFCVSLYLSGHDHCYQRFGESAGPGPVLVVSGGGGKDLYDVAPARRGMQAVAVARAFHWCGVEVAGERMVVVARGIDGREIDRFELALPAGEALQKLANRFPERAARIVRLRR